MTNTELVELLREARGYVEAFGPLQCPEPCESCKNAEEMTARIDAALAEPDAVPPSEVVWKREHLDKDAEIYVAQTDERTVLDVVQFKGERWRWSMSCEARGFCDTLDKAQRAALSAARELK